MFQGMRAPFHNFLLLVGGSYPRQLCDQAGSRSIKIKSALHSLYKLVHPDLFSQYPSEKAENERSLKLLQEYVARSETNDSKSLAYSTVYSFVFFLKTNVDSHLSQTGSLHRQEELGPQLRKVAITLPPPAPTLVEGHLSLTGRKGLSRLLQACGLPELDIFDDAGKSPLSGHLLPFLTEAVEEARLKEVAMVQSGVKIANIRGALRYGRKVLVTMEDKKLDPLQQVKLLEALARVLDTLPHLDLSGCRMSFATRTGISPTGQLLLDVTEDGEDWAYFLDQVDLDYCSQLRRRLEDVKHLEQLVAKSVGVAMIYTTPNSQLHADYRVFLERLSAHALLHGPVKAGEFDKVPVMVPPAIGSRSGPKADATAKEHMDNALGYIRLSVLEEAHTAYNIIQTHGAAAVKVLEGKATREKYEALLTDNTRKMLRLRRLLRDESVTHEQYVAACKQLMQHRTDLVDLTDGQSIRVATANRVMADGSYIDIAWNFEL